MRASLKNNLHPLLVLVGLFVGVALFFGGKPEWAHWVWLATLVGGGLPIVYGTVRGMLKGQFASDIVAMLAIVVALVLNEAFAGAVVVLMQSGGEAIERYGFRKASVSLKALLERAPRRARRQVEGRLEEIDVDQVRVGDRLIVRAGELVPVDGTLVQGEALIDESALTGEPLVREKRVGDRLLSGSVDVNGAIEMRADKVSGESQYAKIVRLVQQAQEEKAPIQRLADRYAILFTPLTLVMALIGYVLTGETTTVLAVLVVATPCPLILATPLAVICGINRAAREGIIVKGGAPIEQVAEVQAALFDKTGTITYGMPILERVVTLGEVGEEELLKAAAALEQFSSHSIAKGIVKQGESLVGKLSLPKDFKEFPGRGVSGVVEGHAYVVGSKSLIEESVGEQSLAQVDAKIGEDVHAEKLLVYVLREKVCVGAFVMSDAIRPGAAVMIRRLYGLGVKKIMMITGDRKKSAETVAKQIGISSFEAELLPEQKVAIVKSMEAKYHPLLMVGDGINDAPALATATVGLAMGAYGTAISAEAANIVLLEDDLSKVADTVEIGKRMLKIAKQSIFIGMGLSFCLMVVASFGLISPPYGALLQEGIDVAVILNALRVL